MNWEFEGGQKTRGRKGGEPTHEQYLPLPTQLTCLCAPKEWNALGNGVICGALRQMHVTCKAIHGRHPPKIWQYFVVHAQHVISVAFFLKSYRRSMESSCSGHSYPTVTLTLTFWWWRGGSPYKWFKTFHNPYSATTPCSNVESFISRNQRIYMSIVKVHGTNY